MASFGSTEKYATKSGPRWVARWRDAKGEKQSKGGFLREGEAKSHLRDLLAGTKGGIAKTVSWLGDEFLEEKSALVAAGLLERTTVEDLYRGHIEGYIQRDEIAKLKLNDIDTPAVNAFLTRLVLITTLKNAKRIRTTLSTMLTWAVGKGYLKINPARDARFDVKTECHDVEAFEDFDDVETDAISIPTPEQVRAILSAADTADNSYRTAAMARLLFNGGLRPSEMLGMPIALMRVIDGRMHMKVAQSAKAKTGKIGKLKNAASRRKIILGAEATRVVRQYLIARGQPKDGLLFPTSTGTALQYKNFHRSVWTPLMGACGFGTPVDRKRTDRKCAFKTWDNLQFTPHHGRHFAASAMIASGAKPKAVQKFLGHATLAITMDTYGHLFPDETRDNDLADALDGMLA